MIREKFLSVLNWLKDHVLFLLEVVIRLSVGLEKKEINQNNQVSDKDTGKE